ncbi:SDR family NAD(P)-dependent oxidoreductase [Sphingomicrobium lutaoense]|uniref:NAD(P)-dependent dehydrogenase (Short-subunit alcohol dehydrogenase family) n=1 Tax=Sphingomicrobium lutaoense TaxID=515949 RepID=A0A839YZQ9_9SPHN|nr:SDR family oxidoreductase [Sphingomicrobium lutaoense]MBB3764486.1 NAD(P)-dependent dehydrogenase (short-subunit alcohol dehydrogenase family) [Sphingomicrobium lutaoense]
MNILITGASRGIGAAAMAALKADGHKVVGQSTRGGDGLIAADFTDPGAPAELWQQAFEALDERIDVLINNAGIFEPVEDNASEEEWHAAWQRTMTVNLQASADLCRLALAEYRSHEPAGGRIVNVASRAAYRGDSARHWHYAASKGGMVAMTKSIARAYASENVLAFAVCPGFTMTGMAEDYVESRGGAKMLADIPLGRVATPEEVGETIRWLATDAPASATGAVIDVNGASFVR